MSSESEMLLEQRNEALTASLIEIDYLISYGMIMEARNRIAEMLPNEALNNELRP